MNSIDELYKVKDLYFEKYQNQAFNTLYHKRYVIKSFIKFLTDNKGEQFDEITHADIEDWIHQYGRINVNTLNGNLVIVRQYLLLCRNYGIKTALPTIRKYSDIYKPYLWRETEIEQLIHFADNIEVFYPSMRNKIYVVPMVLRLLIGCGFRISETLALKVENYDEDKQVLHMYETKNCKARDIPLSSSLAEILEMYIARLRHQNPEAIYLFPGNTGHPHYNIKQFAYDFSKLKSLSGITAETAEHSRGACVHTLRHYFAITSFKKNIDMIESAESAVPYLSYYLGHEDYRETEKYLKFTGSLFPEMIEAFGSYSNELFEDNTYDEEE